MKKELVFRIILILPLALLLLIIYSLALNISSINSFDYGLEYKHLKKDLKRFDFPEFEEEINVTEKSIVFYNFNGAGIRGPGYYQYNYSKEQDLIYVFGASSVVAPDMDHVFPAYLDRKTGEKVINFGMDGIFSGLIRQRISAALDNSKKPGLIILYMGHNDYDRIYWNFKKEKPLIRDSLLEKPAGILENFRFRNYEFTEEIEKQGPAYVPVFTNIDWVIEPNAKKLLERINIIRFNQSYYNKFNRLILKHYSENIYRIIKITQEQDIPLVIITPISNLETEPFGVYEYTTAPYNKGMNEQNYRKRIQLLSAARDNEIYSGHMRAKSDMIDFIRSINETDVTIIDLEKELKKIKFNFSYDDFYDYVHMRKETHKLVAEIVYDNL